MVVWLLYIYVAGLSVGMRIMGVFSRLTEYSIVLSYSVQILSLRIPPL